MGETLRRTNLKGNDGITLIALVITIIVLVTLAGVAISSITGENGIIAKTKEANIQKEKGQIQEILDIALIESKILGKDENEIPESAKEELEKKGYKIKIVVDDESSSVQNINLSETEIQLKEGASKVITVTVEETSYTNRYYVEIEKKYFEIIYNGEEIKIAENETDIDNITGKREITVTGANYSTVVINQSTKEITITGGENLGTDTLIVQYGGKQVTCKVEVGSYITSLSLATSNGTKITKGMKVELKLKKGLTINATTNSDATEQITWTCSNTSITPITVSNDKKTVNLTGGAVGTSTITASTAKIKISFTVKVEMPGVSILSLDATNYGDEIIGYSVLEGDYKVDSWKIFLKDDDGVWIMASDVVELDPETAELEGVKMTTDGIKAYWDTDPENGQEHPNKNCAVALSTTANWTKYVDTNLATKAMGGPTLQMFAGSYNAKYPSKKIEYNEDTKGYQVKWDTDSIFGDYIDGLENDEFYYLENTYWLATPSCNAQSRVMCVNAVGKLSYNYYGHTRNSVRPIVCLKSDVRVESATEDGKTTWTIQ